MSRIIEADRSVVVAADVPSERLPGLVIETATVEGLGGYKVGIRALSVGLRQTVDTVREHSGLPIIYDHQKAGNDIPDMGPQFVEECKNSGVGAVILFPFTGPKTQRKWTEAAMDAGLGVIVGGHMTHDEFIEDKGGYIANGAPERIYTLAAEMGVRNFVVPGNQPELVEYYRGVITDVLGSEDFDLFAPGFITQKGDISETGKKAGKRWHAIVGSGIYGAAHKATEQATAQLFTKIEVTPKPVREPEVEVLTPEQQQLADAFYDAGAVKFGEFTLKSGLVSPIYFDLRVFQRFPETNGSKYVVVDTYRKLLFDLEYDLLAPVPTAAVPYVSSLSDTSGVPMVTPRTDKKGHGTGVTVDGLINSDAGKVVAVVDDLITKADSKLEAVAVLREAGLVVNDVVVLLDREQGGREQLEKQGIKLHAALTMKPLMAYYRDTARITNAQYTEVVAYLASQ